MDIEKEFGTAPHITALAGAMTRSLIICIVIVLAVPYLAALQLSDGLVKVIRTLSFNFAFVLAIVAYITYTVGKAYAGAKIVIQGPHLGVAGIMGSKTIDAGDISSIRVQRSISNFATVRVAGEGRKLSFGLAVDDAPGLVAAFEEFIAGSPTALSDSQREILRSGAAVSAATSPRLCLSAKASWITVWVPVVVGTVTAMFAWKLPFHALLLWLILSILFAVVAHLKAEALLMLGIRMAKDPLKAATADRTRYYVLWTLLSVAVYAGLGIAYKLFWVLLFPR